MRGRLIQKFKARIRRLDTSTQETAGNFDDIFRTPKKSDSTGDGHGSVVRTERDAELLDCQIASPRYENMAQSEMGNDPDSEITLYFFAKDLEDSSLFDSTTGRPLIQVGTRLDAILDRLTGDTVLIFPDGLFCDESYPVGWGLNMARAQRNLVKARFVRRKRAGR
jgi:hypothetical protein